MAARSAINPNPIAAEIVFAPPVVVLVVDAEEELVLVSEEVDPLLDVVVEDSEPLTEDTAEVLVAVDVTFTHVVSVPAWIVTASEYANVPKLSVTLKLTEVPLPILTVHT